MNIKTLLKCSEDPDTAKDLYIRSQTVCIPFSQLNNTISDMIAIYVLPLLEDDTGVKLLDAAYDSANNKVSVPTSQMYIFGPTSYELFLQMIALENVSDSNELTYTSDYEVLYSDCAQATFDNCRSFTSASSDFWNIKNTEYANAFPMRNVHLVRLNTTHSRIGKASSSRTDICLYIPFGEILPNVSTKIVQNKQKFL